MDWLSNEITKLHEKTKSQYLYLSVLDRQEEYKEISLNNDITNFNFSFGASVGVTNYKFKFQLFFCMLKHLKRPQTFKLLR